MSDATVSNPIWNLLVALAATAAIVYFLSMAAVAVEKIVNRWTGEDDSDGE